MQTTIESSYQELAPATLNSLKARSERIKLRLKRTAEDIIAIGQELSEAKAELPHGQFGAWLQNEFEMSDRQAQRFMRVAQQFRDKTDIMSAFSPTVLYALAAPSTPDEVRNMALEMAEQGQVLKSPKEVQELIALEKFQDAVDEAIYLLRAGDLEAEQRKVLLEAAEWGMESALARLEPVRKALMTIRDERLYLKTHQTFEEYCETYFQQQLEGTPYRQEAIMGIALCWAHWGFGTRLCLPDDG